MEKLTDITGKQYPKEQLYKGSSVRKEIIDFIKKEFPSFDEGSYINIRSLNNFRKKYLLQLIADELGDLNAMENQVMSAIQNDELIVRFSEEKYQEQITFGQKTADQVASFGGSWIFILLFFFFIICWVILNGYIIFSSPFDPYPFILLNLILSCLAALQAPIIMMSQNRKEAKDRLRAENDYKVDLKAELEIKLLHDKMDHLLIKQNQHLVKIQELQTDFLEDILNRVNAGFNKTRNRTKKS